MLWTVKPGPSEAPPRCVGFPALILWRGGSALPSRGPTPEHVAVSCKLWQSARDDLLGADGDEVLTRPTTGAPSSLPPGEESRPRQRPRTSEDVGLPQARESAWADESL